MTSMPLKVEKNNTDVYRFLASIAGKEGKPFMAGYSSRKRCDRVY